MRTWCAMQGLIIVILGFRELVTGELINIVTGSILFAVGVVSVLGSTVEEKKHPGQAFGEMFSSREGRAN